MNLSTLLDPQASAKAYAGGAISLLVAEAARFGWHPSGQAVSIANIIVTGIVSYVLGHLTVWLTTNKAGVSK